jgi:hypothetical protein
MFSMIPLTKSQLPRASPEGRESYGSLEVYAPGNLTIVPVFVPEPVTLMFAHLGVLVGGMYMCRLRKGDLRHVELGAVLTVC